MLDSNYFHYTGTTLCCDDVRLEELAGTFGTPLFVTSARSLIESYQAFEHAFEALAPFYLLFSQGQL